jgi:CheY-like chemotaxis protein
MFNEKLDGLFCTRGSDEPSRSTNEPKTAKKNDEIRPGGLSGEAPRCRGAGSVRPRRGVVGCIRLTDGDLDASGKVMTSAKILVVDDEPGILRLVSKALSAKGYEVHAVDSATKALQVVNAVPCFDVVLSDVIMPDMSGPELVRKLIETCPEAGVVFMSAHMASEKLPETAVFIRKPFKLTDLYSVVEEMLSPRR